MSRDTLERCLILHSASFNASSRLALISVLTPVNSPETRRDDVIWLLISSRPLSPPRCRPRSLPQCLTRVNERGLPSSASRSQRQPPTQPLLSSISQLNLKSKVALQVTPILDVV